MATVRFTEPPRTLDSLAADLAGLGLRAGDTVLAHSSLRSLGYVVGGATTVVAALLEVLGSGGTLVVPAQTSDTRDPSRWTHPAVPSRWWDTLRDHLPGFDPLLSPTTMGAIPERVRTWPGAVRSGHPVTSFAAFGADAGQLLADHPLASPLGEESPLARLEAADARILLLGVGYDRCTAFHLAEYRLPDPPLRTYTCLVATADGGRRWMSYDAVDLDSGDFRRLGAAFAAGTGLVRMGRVGAAASRLLPLRAAVRFAGSWLARHRRPARLPAQRPNRRG